MKPEVPILAPPSSSPRDAETERRGGARWPAQLAVVALVAAAVWALADAAPVPSLRLLLQSHVPIWVPASAIVFWRWGWALTHWARAAIYRYVAYPRLRRRALAAVQAGGTVPELAIVLATYKERPSVTRRVVLSVMAELGRIEGLRTPPLFVCVTGSDADDEAIRNGYEEGIAAFRPGGARAPELVLLRGADGKRDALARGLEFVAARGLCREGVFVMMDGDTHFGEGALTRTLPLFRLTPPVHAVTTNEHAHVQAPAWFSEWIHMRHGQRHLYNCSIALSNQLLCLTGRYSVFRGAVLEPGFIEIVRNDNVVHWLWGRYKLLSGDDKSTWFYLLSRGMRLLYAPDAVVVTHEVVSQRPFLRAYHNLRRWGGNMMRNSERAIAVGPRRLGLFCWWCLIDQRVSVFTTLIGPTAAAYTLARHRPDLVAAYLIWVICSRTVRALPSWLHGRRVSFFYAPLAVVFDWANALVKIWVMSFPARQFWLNRGARELDSTRGRTRVRERQCLAAVMLVVTLGVYVLAVGRLVGAVPVARDLGFVWADLQSTGIAPWEALLAVGALSAFVVSRLRITDANALEGDPR